MAVFFMSGIVDGDIIADESANLSPLKNFYSAKGE
jgi:hypothetical protein